MDIPVSEVPSTPVTTHPDERNTASSSDVLPTGSSDAVEENCWTDLRYNSRTTLLCVGATSESPHLFLAVSKNSLLQNSQNNDRTDSSLLYVLFIV